MSNKENDIYLQQMRDRAEEAIKLGSEEDVTAILHELHDYGYLFEEAVLKKQWENAQEVDVK